MKDLYIRVKVELILPITDDECRERLANDESGEPEEIVDDWVQLDSGRTFLDAAQLASVKKVIGWTELSEEEKRLFQ